MIRGNIELVTPESVQGWIYTQDDKVRDKLLLAFRGDKCIGSGKVSIFRSDLADAGLGDGHLGFNFPISVDKGSVGSVVIRIDGSDAVLLQVGAAVEVAHGASRKLDEATVSRQLASLKWALKRCRISQADFDFLRILWSFGVYERGLLRRNESGDITVADSPMAIATGLLESYLGFDTEISAFQVQAATFKDQMAHVAGNPKLAPVVALMCKSRAVVQVKEGSHVAVAGDGDGDRGFSPIVHYTVSSENLIVIDSRITAELSLPAGKSVEVITASSHVD